MRALSELDIIANNLEEQELFLLSLSEKKEPYWLLIDSQSEKTLHDITEQLPGLIPLTEWTTYNQKFI